MFSVQPRKLGSHLFSVSYTAKAQKQTFSTRKSCFLPPFRDVSAAGVVSKHECENPARVLESKSTNKWTLLPEHLGVVSLGLLICRSCTTRLSQFLNITICGN